MVTIVIFLNLSVTLILIVGVVKEDVHVKILHIANVVFQKINIVQHLLWCVIQQQKIGSVMVIVILGGLEINVPVE